MKKRLNWPWWRRLQVLRKRKEGFRLIQQQRFILQQGMEATAEVMEMLLYEPRVGNLVPARLWVKLRRPDSSFIYTHADTLLSPSRIPGKGEMLRIKYIPDNLNTILIL